MQDKYGNDVDETKFNPAVSDLKGHDTRITFRCQKGVAAQLQMILNSKKFPYTSVGAAIRHAIMRHFHWLNTIAPVKGVLAQIEVIDRILAQEEFAETFSGVFERISSRISSYMSANEKGEAIRLVRTIQDQIKEMDDGYWRDKYAKEIHDRWGHLMSQAETVNLAGSEEE